MRGSSAQAAPHPCPLPEGEGAKTWGAANRQIHVDVALDVMVQHGLEEGSVACGHGVARALTRRGSDGARALGNVSIDDIQLPCGFTVLLSIRGPPHFLSVGLGCTPGWYPSTPTLPDKAHTLRLAFFA